MAHVLKCEQVCCVVISKLEEKNNTSQMQECTSAAMTNKITGPVVAQKQDGELWELMTMGTCLSAQSFMFP